MVVEEGRRVILSTVRVFSTVRKLVGGAPEGSSLSGGGQNGLVVAQRGCRQKESENGCVWSLNCLDLELGAEEQWRGGLLDLVWSGAKWEREGERRGAEGCNGLKKAFGLAVRGSARSSRVEEMGGGVRGAAVSPEGR